MTCMKPEDNPLVCVHGSHGDLTVDRLNGAIIEKRWACNDGNHTGTRCDECGDEGGYGNIDRFDPADFAKEPDSTCFDVLGVGYWTTDGIYEPAMTSTQEDGWMPWTDLVDKHLKALRELGCAVVIMTPEDIQTAGPMDDNDDPTITHAQASRWLRTHASDVEEAILGDYWGDVIRGMLDFNPIEEMANA